MTTDPQQDSPFVAPNLSNSPQLKIDKQVYYTLPCPKCSKDLNVTGIQEGRNVECPKCKNITILPSFRPRWWHTTRNFILSVIVSLIIGMASSLVASYIYYNVAQNTADNLTLQKGDSHGN